jgi:hypothetical protein
VATVSSFRVTIYASGRVAIVTDNRFPAVANMANRKMYRQIGVSFRDHSDRFVAFASIPHKRARKFNFSVKFDDFVFCYFEHKPFRRRAKVEHPEVSNAARQPEQTYPVRLRHRAVLRPREPAP